MRPVFAASYRRIGFAIAATLLPAGLGAQTIRLVRCVAAYRVPCLSTRLLLDGDSAAIGRILAAPDTAWVAEFAGMRLTNPGIVRFRGHPSSLDFTFAVPGGSVMGLARGGLVGSLWVRLSDGGDVRHALVWRPPLVALPGLRGAADPMSITPAFRESLVAGEVAIGRSSIAVLLAIIVVSAWIVVPRVLWTGSRQGGVTLTKGGGHTTRAGAIGRSATQTAMTVGSGSEGAPRRPDEITQQTARRTAQER